MFITAILANIKTPVSVSSSQAFLHADQAKLDSPSSFLGSDSDFGLGYLRPTHLAGDLPSQVDYSS